MRNLADLGRWMLETPRLKAEWGEKWWKIAFEACGSPAEWAEFLRLYESDPRSLEIRVELERIDNRNQILPRSRMRQPVELPDFGD